MQDEGVGQFRESSTLYAAKPVKFAHSLLTRSQSDLQGGPALHSGYAAESRPMNEFSHKNSSLRDAPLAHISAARLCEQLELTALPNESLQRRKQQTARSLPQRGPLVENMRFGNVLAACHSHPIARKRCEPEVATKRDHRVFRASSHCWALSRTCRAAQTRRRCSG